MVRLLPIRGALILWLAGVGLCQQREAKLKLDSLPEAPSAQASASEEQTLKAAFKGERVGVSPAWAGGSGATLWAFAEKPEGVQEQQGDFFERHLYPALLKRNLDYRPSMSSTLMGRATYAASRIFFTQDESGRGRLNSSYFLGVLSAAMVHVASRPYWNRSAAAPFSDFGSTIGNDAGMNLLHEFRPGLEQLMKSHTPRFVSRIEERLGHN